MGDCLGSTLQPRFLLSHALYVPVQRHRRCCILPPSLCSSFPAASVTFLDRFLHRFQRLPPQKTLLDPFCPSPAGLVELPLCLRGPLCWSVSLHLASPLPGHLLRGLFSHQPACSLGACWLHSLLPLSSSTGPDLQTATNEHLGGEYASGHETVPSLP